MSRKNASPTPAQVVENPNIASVTGEEILHRFTPIQQDALNTLFSQMEQLNNQTNFFLTYVIREAGLPEMPAGTYGLSRDRKGIVRNQVTVTQG